MKKEIITSNDPKSPISEVFRSLRTNMQYMNTKKKLSMVVTSTMQGEGKSFIAANLAVTFAQAGKNTIIIDADMRRPRQHKIFENDMYPGMSNYLSGVSLSKTSREITLNDCIYKTKITNLSIMPAGNIPPNPSELLLSGNLKKLIDQLEENFDVIIFDGAPCLLVTDATIIARKVNYTILVASQNKTKIEDLKEAQRKIKHVGGHLAGVVLNRVKISKKEYGNKYFYGLKPSYGDNRHFSDRNDDDIYDFKIDVKEEKELEEVAKEEKKTTNKTTKVEKEVKETEQPPDKIQDILEQINKLKESSK